MSINDFTYHFSRHLKITFILAILIDDEAIYFWERGGGVNPANATCGNNDVLMLVQRRRRWANIKTSLFPKPPPLPLKALNLL